ncbi:septum formation family protein [Naasia sp. SYSU D00057]|uniref:septum formation family protein n=1 Tax=Naasia sp. SYSU D00057 TaxID=2817380 RepID=UPI001B317D4F|nr:septum formation family protein [Naasia sp. SYSU D00057]
MTGGGGSVPAPATPDPDPDAPAEGEAAARDRRSRIVVIVSIAVLALAGLALAFLVGTRLQPAPPPPAPETTAAPVTPTPTPTPTPTLAPLPAAPAAPGVVSWEELGGGECLDPWASPWAREFTVVDCVQPHRAQLVARGVFDGDALAPYPGEQALTSQLGLRCASPDVVDLVTAEQYADLQYQAAYPATEEQWAAGDRSYFCFVFRGSGEPLTGSVAVAS